MTPKNRRKKSTRSLCLIAPVFACFAFVPQILAALPPEIQGNPDGCYPGYTTAEGCDAINSLTTGVGNTGLGWRSLFLNSTGNFNTGVGAGALALNNADSNTAIGTGAMLLNTVGFDNVAVGTNALLYGGSYSNAVGAFALFNNGGISNNAVGASALFNNIDGYENSAFGDSALFNNINAYSNTAVGWGALNQNDVTGNGLANYNTAVGLSALFWNNDGSGNTAVGVAALANGALGCYNTAIGLDALTSSGGDNNVAMGAGAGIAVATASNVTCIGANVSGADVSNTTWIGNVYGVTTQNATTAPVIVSADGQLGTIVSAARFKTDIATMDKASEVILSLRPVTFHYKTDTKCTPQFGLIAEEVAKVNPALVLPDKEGKPYTVRYEAVNAMLLNEFLKEHREVQKLKKEVAALTAGLQKVSAQLELRNSGAQITATSQ